MSNELQMTVALPDALLSEIASRVMAQLERPRARFLSKPALADHYGVSERTIKTWREKGLPGVRVGRGVMFDVSDCDRWIESHA
jgi:Helix-turn-helix domain